MRFVPLVLNYFVHLYVHLCCKKTMNNLKLDVHIRDTTTMFGLWLWMTLINNHGDSCPNNGWSNSLRLMSGIWCHWFRTIVQLSELPRPIPWNQTPDVHRWSTLLRWRWRHRNHANKITRVIAAKQTVTTCHNKHCYKCCLGVFNKISL